jgi:3-dehydroshikimate dehydratase
MLTPGLVSITFRALTPDEIIRLVVQAGPQPIEWGGDIHVPEGNLERARQVGRSTRDAGLAVSAYGSYYRLGGVDKVASFERTLASAVELGAPTIRVWAGGKGSADALPQERGEIIEDALRISEKAARAGITISLEYHGGTLTDTQESVRSLLNELADPNIQFLWQPPTGESVEMCVDRLNDVLPRMRNVHVFQWWPTHRDRLPLIEGEACWRVYIDIVRKSGRSAEFLLEFVANESPEQFLADATSLRRLLEDTP